MQTLEFFIESCVKKVKIFWKILVLPKMKGETDSSDHEFFI